MESRDYGRGITRYACAWCASRWGGHADRNYGKAWSLRSRRFYSCITQRKAVRSVSPMKKSKTCACFDGEISDGKSTMRLVIVAHLGCVVFLLRCRAVLCLSRSRAGRQRAKWIALLLARKSSPFTVVVVFHHLNVFCTRSLASRRRLSSKSKSSHRIVSSSAPTGGTCRSYT